MNKTIYVPDDKAQILADFEKLFKGEKRLSRFFVESIEKAVKEKKEMADCDVFVMYDENKLPLKLIGKRLASFSGSYLKGNEYYKKSGESTKGKRPEEIAFMKGWVEDTTSNAEKVFNAYKTRSGKYYVEVKGKTSEGDGLSEILYIKELIEFFRDPYNYKQIHTRFPEIFIERFRTSVEIDHITTVID